MNFAPAGIRTGTACGVESPSGTHVQADRPARNTSLGDRGRYAKIISSFSCAVQRLADDLAGEMCPFFTNPARSSHFSVLGPQGFCQGDCTELVLDTLLPAVGAA